MGAMAFLETAIPPRDAGVPRRVGGDARRRDGGRGADRDRPADRPGLGLLGGRGLGHVRLGRRLGRPFLLARGGPRRHHRARGSRSSTPGSTATAPPAVCLGRLVPLVRPFGPLVAGASQFPYRRFLPWNLLGTLLFSLVFCGLGYVFYRSYDEVAAALSRSAFALRGPGARWRSSAYVLLPPSPPRRGGRAVTRVLALATLIAAATLTALLMFGGGDGGYTLKARFENAGQVVKGGLVEIAGQAGGHGDRPAAHRRRDGGADAEDRRRLGADPARHARADPPVRAVGPGQPLHRAAAAHGRRARRRPARRRPARARGHHLERGHRRDLRDLRPPHARVAEGRVPRLRAPVRGPGRAGARRAAVPRPRAGVRQPPVRRAEPRHARAAPLHQRELGPGGRPGRPPRRPGLAGEQPGRHHRGDRAAAGRARGRDPAAAAVHAPGQHHLREPARDARRPRPAGARLQAGGEEAAALHRRAAPARTGTPQPTVRDLAPA